MKTVIAPAAVLLLILSAPLLSQDRSWTKQLKDRSQRSTLHDAYQFVRGDSGKWNDHHRLLHAPQKPEKLSLDDWAEQVLEKKFQLTAGDVNWLLFRTRQLDDYDRLWVERIERDGNRFTVTVSEAIWQGKYRKNFTYYSVVGVKLGKLEPGKYEARWIVKPLEFKTFNGDGRPRGNWPQDEQPAKKKPVELSIKFTVAAAQ